MMGVGWKAIQYVFLGKTKTAYCRHMLLPLRSMRLRAVITQPLCLPPYPKTPAVMLPHPILLFVMDRAAKEVKVTKAIKGSKVIKGCKGIKGTKGSKATKETKATKEIRVTKATKETKATKRLSLVGNVGTTMKVKKSIS
jgi:hypothetical protein